MLKPPASPSALTHLKALRHACTKNRQRCPKRVTSTLAAAADPTCCRTPESGSRLHGAARLIQGRHMEPHKYQQQAHGWPTPFAQTPPPSLGLHTAFGTARLIRHSQQQRATSRTSTDTHQHPSGKGRILYSRPWPVAQQAIAASLFVI
jgi:hypothetical protein